MELIFKIIALISLLGMSAIFSGLNIGLMSISKAQLKRKIKIGNKYAEKIYPIRKNGTLLIVSLLLGNTAVNATIVLVLKSITGSLTAGLLATALIVLFGEIIPQAIFFKNALYLGAKTAWLARATLIVFYPFAKPLSMILDKIIGVERSTVFSKKEWLIFLEDQRMSKRSELDEDEFDILEGGLEFSKKMVKDVMTPWSRTFFIEQDVVFTKKWLDKLKQVAHSRNPVWDPSHKRVVGLLYTKDIVNVLPDDKIVVKSIMRKNVFFIREYDRLDFVLNLFRQKKIHLFLVADRKKKIVGIITLEDVLEEIVGEIVDEYDDIIARKERK